MTRILLGSALALACLTAAACTTSSSSPAPTLDPLAARIAAEAAFNASVLGVETNLQAGVLHGADLADTRTALIEAHAVVLAGRLALTASGAPTSAALTAAQAQGDADFARVYALLPAT